MFNQDKKINVLEKNQQNLNAKVDYLAKEARLKQNTTAAELNSIIKTVAALRSKHFQKLVKSDGIRKQGLRLVGQEMQVVMFIGLDECFDLCKNQLHCTAATLSTQWSQSCYLFKRGDFSQQADTNWTSFVKEL